MKVLFKKRNGIDVYDIYKDGIKTKYSVSKDSFLSTPYYLVYYGKRLSGRFGTIKECQNHIGIKLLDEEADRILDQKI